jgi:hypothetical protein
MSSELVAVVAHLMLERIDPLHFGMLEFDGSAGNRRIVR